MPNVHRFEARHQLKRLGPISSRVAGDGCFSVPLGPLFHVPRLRCTEAVQARTIARFRIQLNSVRRIADHQPRLASAEQPRDSFRAGGVAEEHAVKTEKSYVSKPRNW
jgi:hypothetical protein